MSSKRSARLPPTPTSAASNKTRLANYSAYGEQNSNNVLQCGGTGNDGGMSAAMMLPYGELATETAAISGATVDSGMARSGGGVIPAYGIQQTTVTTVGEGLAGDENAEMSMATTQVLEHLSENERKMIIEVLNRDENVRQRDATRIMLLRAELYSLRRRGTLKIGNTFNGGPQSATQQLLETNQNLPSTHPLLHESNRHCARCNTELGRITNRGAPCRVCKLRVCKTCREFTTRTTDWVCVVCHKQIEIQASSTGDWAKEAAPEATQDNQRASIRRSWTISNPEDDSNNPNAQPPVGDNLYPQQQHLVEAQSAGSYPSLLRHQTPRSRPINYHTGSAIAISAIGIGSSGSAHQMTDYHVNPQRRVLRQSTLPNSLSKNDSNLTGSGVNLANYNCVNLTAPTSPHQMQKTPLYPTAYNSEDMIQMSSSTDSEAYRMQSQPQLNLHQPAADNVAAAGPTHSRLQVRRQSTLPANPGQAFMYNSTSPNRMYSRSPERSPGEQRYPPFMRQTSFPCNMQEPMSQHHLNVASSMASSYVAPHRGKLLPQQPQQASHVFDNQPAGGHDDPEYGQSGMKPRMMRQATLPNPEQHVKLLPTSPPKRQTSPQYRRSPEFMRQQTLPNPEAFSGNSLTVHQPGIAQAKFMPISPRQKQNFLFPSNPRPFLSQQNVPCVGIAEATTDEQYSSSQSVNIHQQRDHAKMMKVRSHSNEEYSITKPLPSEGRRLLPEIPTNRSCSRSPSRLVRQDCLKEERGSAGGIHEMHGRTFGEAKQQFHQFQDVTEEEDQRPEYADFFGDPTNSFLEADEMQYEKTYNSNYASEPRIIYNDGSDSGSYNPNTPRQMVHSAENVIGHEPAYLYNIGGTGQGLSGVGIPGGAGATGRAVELHNRLRRRLSKEMAKQELNEKAGPNLLVGNAANREDAQLVWAAAEGPHDRRKPEQMRSISEDGAKPNTAKPVTRRSLSHPEHDSKTQKKTEPTKIPSPKPLADILDKTRQSKIPAPIRRHSRGSIGADTTEGGTLKSYLNERRNSDQALRDGRKQDENRQDQPKKDPEKENNETKVDNQQEEKTEAKPTEPKEGGVTEADGNAAKNHTTTLGEQEIQNAVEAAAVIFKKVVLQRRQEKKAAEEDSPNDMETSSELDIKSLTINHQYYQVDADEFKLVFLNSDSGSWRDDDSSSNASSSPNCNSITIDDCDWDYFEPSMLSSTTTTTVTTNHHHILYSPMASPRGRRRCLSRDFKSSDSTASPMDSPLLYRKQLLFCPRIRESDTGTDDDTLMQGETSSQTSSDSYLTKPGHPMNLKARIKTKFLSRSEARGSAHPRHGATARSDEPCKALGGGGAAVAACSCRSADGGYKAGGQPPHYVPIPVPVPYPVPMAAFPNWQPSQMLPASEEGALCASIQKLWGTNLTDSATGVSSNLHAAAAAAVVAAYSNAASLDAMQHLAAAQADKPQPDAAKPALSVGSRSFASAAAETLGAAAMNQSLCSSTSGYETTATGGSLEMLSSGVAATGGESAGVVVPRQARSLARHDHRTGTAELGGEVVSVRARESPSRTYLSSDGGSGNKISTTPAVAGDSHHHQRRRQQLRQLTRSDDDDGADGSAAAVGVHLSAPSLAVSSASRESVATQRSVSLSRFCAESDDGPSHKPHTYRRRETSGNETTPTSGTPTTKQLAHELSSKLSADNDKVRGDSCRTSSPTSLPSPTEERSVVRVHGRNPSGDRSAVQRQSPVSQQPLAGVAAGTTTKTTPTTTEANICNSTTGLTKVDTQQQSQQLAKQPPQPQPRKTPQASSSEKRRSIERAEAQVAGTTIKRLSNTINESSESVQVQHNKAEEEEANEEEEVEETTAASSTTKQSRCDSPVRRLGPHGDCRCTCTSAVACPVGAAAAEPTESGESIDADIDDKVSPDTAASAASVCSELARRKDVVPQQRTAFERCSMITIGKLESQSSDGYLQSENVFLSSECSASDEEEEGGLEEPVGSGENLPTNSQLKASNSKFGRRRHPPVQRTYEFAAVARRDELISTANDDSSHSGGDASAGATSSSVSSSDSVDSDDTGTIADHKPKRRHFSKVFVVNRARHHRRPHGGSSTENDSLSSSDANLEDSSDNDTDTERTDCGIVLHYVKPIGEDGEKDRPEAAADRLPAAFNFDKDAESESASNKESECDDDDEEDARQTAAEELANCIIVVGGRTDDTKDAVVLNSVRMLGDDDAAHASASTDQRRNSLGAAPTKESEQLRDATALACEQLHTIANDVNRLLTLTKQNSGLELKLQKLRRGVEEINQDHLAGTWRASASGGESRAASASMASHETDATDMQWAVGSPPGHHHQHHSHPVDVVGAGIAQMPDECASSGEPLAEQLHCKYHKQPHEEITKVDLLASERTSAHEQHTTESDGGEARDIGAGCAGGGGGGGVGLAGEQVFGGDKADDDASENSSHSNGEARTPIYTDVLNDGDDDDGGGNSGVDGVRVGNASHARADDDDAAAARGDVVWENLKYTGSRNGNNSSNNNNHQQNKSNNENLRTITAYRPFECGEQQQRQHRKQVNTMRDGDAYGLATTATSGHERRTTSHNNNNASSSNNNASSEGEVDNWANEVKQHLRAESQLSEDQHKTHRREERVNEACKTNELADDAQHFMDLGQQQQHEHDEQSPSQVGELAACEQYRKTPESDAKQVASQGNGNENTSHNNNNDKLKSVRVAGNNNNNINSSNKENSFACDQAVRATTPSLMLAADEVLGGLAKTARAVKNEMLNTIDGGSQVSDVFAVDQSIVAEGGSADDVNGNEKKSAAAVATEDIHEAAGNIVLREQTGSSAGEWSNKNGNNNGDNTTSSSTSKSLVAVAEESVRSGHNTFDEESVRGFVCKITTNTNNNNYQSNKNNRSDEASEFAEENDDDEEEIDIVHKHTNLDISEVGDSDSGARVLDAYYSPYYGDIAARGTHPKTMSSPNSLSAKYRSLTMITANASAAAPLTISTETTTTTARSSSPPSAAQLTCLPTNSSTVNTSRVAESNSDVVSESSSRNHQNPSETKLRINVNERLGESTTTIIGQAGDSCDKLSSTSTVSLRTVTPAASHRPTDGHGQLDQSGERLRDHSRDGHDEMAEMYGGGTAASAKSTLPVVCLEDGLADDDSWVEEISQNEEDIEDITTPTASDSEEVSVDGDDCNVVNGMFVDREEELRGYHRSAIDFTLHTIVEESCEESEVASMRCTEDEDMDEAECRRLRTLNHHNRLSASDLEKYFFFGLGDGKVMSSIDTRGDDTASEVSSECSEGLDSLGMAEEISRDQTNSAAELASSRLEKYFLSGFMGFSGNEKDECDESGSVGSDSEGHPSPSQRRKRLVRARGTPRSHNSSLDNLLVDTQAAGNDPFEATVMGSSACELDDSSESDAADDTLIAHGDKVGDSAASDTMKRKKQVRKRHDSLDDKKLPDSNDECGKMAAGSECRTPTPGSIGSQAQAKKQQHHSRDSGFVGSNDDLLKAPECEASSGHPVAQPKSPPILEQIAEFSESPSTSKRKLVTSVAVPGVRTNLPASGLQADGLSKKPPLPPTSSLVRKDSFNNWSSDEETNLMMSKMRQFFKTLVVATANAQQNYSSSNSNSKAATPNQTTPVAVRRTKSRTPQLAYFENELTRLMKTVPGINDEQVRELVEYLSSEDTWSDSYDSSDYNSSDLEGSNRKKSELKEQISASCQRIINKFEVDEEGDRGDGGLLDETHALNLDTALVYQKLVASFSKMPAMGNPSPPEASTTDGVAESPAASSTAAARPAEEDSASTSSQRSTERSPQLFAKVMQHIGTRLVALMHEVNSGNDSHGTNSPQPAHRQGHKRLQAKISITTTEDEEESPAEASNSKANRLHPAHAPQQPHHPHQQHTQAPQTAKNKQLDDAKKLARSKSHDLLLDVPASPPSGVAGMVGGGGGGAANSGQPHHHQSSSGVSDTAGEECGVASDYERFSWRGSFESALLANGDSRTKLSQLDRDNLSSASALAIAKRRSAGDLLFNHKSLSREQLDRVRSCGSIGGGDERHHELEASPAKPWVSSTDSRDARRSSVPDAIYESDSSSEENAFGARSTLPRVLAGVTQVASTNSLPRLSSSSLGNTSTPNQMTKSQGALNFGPSVGGIGGSGGGGGASAKSARYRSPGLSGRPSATKSANASFPVSQNLLYTRRDARKRLNMSAEEAKAAAEELNRSPIIGERGDAAATSPQHSRGSASSDAWPAQSDEDIDRLVAMHQNRASFSSLGVRSDSMASVYSGAGEGRYGTVVVKGQVEFKMQYNYRSKCLEVHVVRCKDLAPVEVRRNRSDPYVKVYLLPDKSKSGKRKTKVKKHTLNPIFDEWLRFQTPISSLESRTLWLSVWHSDMFGRNNFLGEVSVSLQGKVFDNPQSQWYTLQERSEPFDEIAAYRGDIVVGLKFIPPESAKAGFSRGSATTGSSSNLRKFGSIKSVTTKSERSTKGGQLHVLVKEAKHLSPIKANGTCDAFCKSYLLPDRTRSSKQKTPVVKRSLHPSWNYTFVYEDVSLEDLSERSLELTVWDHDRLASNEFIGGVRFSLGTGKSYGRLVDWMDASGKELSLWQNMLNRPNFWVEGSLMLKSTLDGARAVQ